MWPFKRRPPVQGDQWIYWDYDDPDEGLHGMTFIQGAFLEARDRPRYDVEIQVSLVFPDAYLVAGRFPSPEGHGAAIELEDALISLLERDRVDCVQSARCTYDGSRRFVFEVADPFRFKACMERWRQGVAGFELHERSEAPWTIYAELAPDEHAWRRIGNRQLIERLVANGSDPGKPHELEVGIDGDHQALERLEKVLEAEQGRRLSLEDGHLEIAFQRVLDLDVIDDLIALVVDRAEAHDCRYDGWSTSIVR